MTLETADRSIAAMTHPDPVVYFIGYPRTGSTFLQSHVLPDLKAQLAARGERVFANEDIAGSALIDRLDYAQRLANRHADAKVVIVLRSQATIIPSTYSIYLKQGGRLSFDRYLGQIIANKKFFYYDLVAEYIRVFGRERVYVALFENFRADPKTYVSALCGFVDATAPDLPEAVYTELVNKGRTPGGLVATRWANILLGMPLSQHTLLYSTAKQRWRYRFEAAQARLARLLPLPQAQGAAMTPARMQVLHDVYSPQNSLLEEVFGLPLAAAGYPMAGDQNALT